MVAIALAKKTNLKESLLTPRFYTTNFDVVAKLDLSAQSDELQAMLTEMRADYNRGFIAIATATPQYLAIKTVNALLPADGVCDALPDGV